MELRALDNSNLDKYWLCHQCLPTTQIYKIRGLVSNNNTSTAIRYLKKDHKVVYNEEESSTSSSPILSGTISSLFRTVNAKAADIAQGLITRIRIDDFRWFLLK
jgi:hypothetical protein